MAERRMFSKKIVASGDFLCLSPTARLLYYDLGMHADDDGVAEALPVMRMTGAEQSDLDALAAHGYLQVLTPSLVVHLVHWQRHNHVQKDRYQPSLYQHLIPPARRPRYTARRRSAPAPDEIFIREDPTPAPDEIFIREDPTPAPDEIFIREDPTPTSDEAFIRQDPTPASDPLLDPSPEVSSDFVGQDPTPVSDPLLDPFQALSSDFVGQNPTPASDETFIRQDPTPASDPLLDPFQAVSSDFVGQDPTQKSDPPLDPSPEVSSNFIRQDPTPTSDETSIRQDPAQKPVHPASYWAPRLLGVLDPQVRLGQVGGVGPLIGGSTPEPTRELSVDPTWGLSPCPPGEGGAA